MTNRPRYADKSERDKLECPFHGWPFDKCGEWCHARQMKDALDYLDARLQEAQAREAANIAAVYSIGFVDGRDYENYDFVTALSQQDQREQMRDEKIPPTARELLDKARKWDELQMVDNEAGPTTEQQLMAERDAAVAEVAAWSEHHFQYDQPGPCDWREHIPAAARELLDKARKWDEHGMVDDEAGPSTVQQLMAERDAYREDAEKHAEAEASVCPEDVGCVEYIKALQRENAALRQALKRCSGGTPTSCYSCYDALAQLRDDTGVDKQS